MDIKEIQNLIRFVAKSGASEVKLETEDIKITIKTTSESAGQAEATIVQQIPVHAAMAPVAAAPAAPAEPTSPPPAAASTRSDLLDITAPMVGTFYRAPAPGEPAFIEVGNRVDVGQTVCILEAMKLMNELEAEVSGEVVEILVDNGTPVEFGQVLMRVKPA